MKSLPTLIRLAQRDLDLLRRVLADQLGKRQAVDERIAAHAQALAAEQALAVRDYESARAYGGYAAFALAGRKALEGEGAAIDAESERLRGLIAEAHIEVKKLERLLELQQERERKAAAKREDDQLDEMATLRAGAMMRARRG